MVTVYSVSKASTCGLGFTMSLFTYKISSSMLKSVYFIVLSITVVWNWKSCISVVSIPLSFSPFYSILHYLNISMSVIKSIE